jgi:predicted  nucleic acid-binding Zn-ribbon protein
MRDQITALEALQQLDLELRELEENLQRYPKEISRYKEELQNSKESIAKTKKELEQIIKKKAELERKLAENHDAIKKSEKRLFEIKTYKEYEALQKEISETKRANAELEEQTLQEMEKIERLETLIKEKELELSQKEREYEDIINEYTKKIDALKDTYEIKKREKEKVASLISHEILSIYERIRKRNGVALVPTRNEVCTGCNMNIPPQLFNEVLTFSKMIQCPNCHRILYVEESTYAELRTA